MRMNRATALARGFGPTNVTKDDSPFIKGTCMSSTPKNKGFLLAIEGPDGSGKTTMRDFMQEYFSSVGIVPVMTREPGGTPLAEQIREKYILADRESLSEPISPMAETLLFMAARALHLDNMVKPRLAEGSLVITDRFCDSTFCYQGAGRGLDIIKLREMHNLAFDGIVPDLTIVLDGDPEIFRKRLALRGESSKLNHFDKMGSDFHYKTRNLYRDFAWANKERYVLIDAEVNEEQVKAQLIPHLMNIDSAIRTRPVV